MIRPVTTAASWVGIMILNVYSAKDVSNSEWIELEGSGSQMKARHCVRSPA